MPFPLSLALVLAAVFGVAGESVITDGKGDASEIPSLLSHEQIVALARRLAIEHPLAPAGARGRPLDRIVARNARVLFQSFRDLASAAHRHETITPAAEWLVDNFHIVEEQIVEIAEHLPRRYYTELPKLKSGPLAGYPRVYAFALAMIAHSDAALDEHCLTDSIRAYQEREPLQLGELWAVPIMLRAGLLDRLGCLAEPLEARRRARAEADAWANRVVEAAAKSPAEVTVLVGELAQRRQQLSPVYVSRLHQRLRGRGPAVAPVLEWLSGYFERKTGPALDEQVRLENHQQAATQVSISNIITSFRLLDRIDWEAFIERTSPVEELLRQDPSGAYSQSDFKTRDACRHAVERIARRTRRPEIEIAAAALEMARASTERDPGDPRAGHVGYYLNGHGCRLLEREVAYRPTARELVLRLAEQHATPLYLGGIAFWTVLVVLLAVWFALLQGASAEMGVLVAALALLPATDLAVGFQNWLLSRWLPPRVLPKRDLSSGIPADCRTLVVVPTLLASEAQLQALLQRLEIHYLANADPQLHFALLTDFTDAPAQEQPGDDILLHTAIQGILSLNARHEGPNSYHRFFLFHRPRQWNPAQGCWMGWERKRGKLMELNRLLRGALDTGYATVIGDRASLIGVRYVLCLDGDTQLPPGAAHRLIGTLSHPLNGAVVDPRSGLVVEGYGILQPRVSIDLPSAGRSLFTRIFSGNVGVDPYTTAVSDVYQDLFGEGIFCGKGLYEIDAFEQVLEGKVPDNALLSHDLFEGSFARCGLVTDVELFDDYPARYATFAARQHRWIRGDWQLLPWLLPRVCTADGTRARNPLSVISRWKILDNLRRSLLAPALLLFFAAAWLQFPGPPWAWTLGGLLVVAFPIFAHLAGALLIDPRGVSWGSHLWGVWTDAGTNLKQTALSLAFLPHQAYSSLDAICRTAWRLFVTRRSLLEWQTAAEAERRIDGGPRGYWGRMWPATGAAAALFLLLARLRPEAMPIAAPLLLLWSLSPLISYQVSQALPERIPPLTAADQRMLRCLARQTWRFFQDVVTARDHWLPPDNYQEDRADPLAHRTSPTNMGLLLLSTLSARDLGYVGLLELMDRLERTLGGMAELERHRGHFYNWYDTLGPAAIQPFYISTVDSGNLAGHLLAVRQACLALPDQPAFLHASLEGLEDTLAALRAELADEGNWLRRECDALEAALRAAPASGLDWHAKLQEISAAAERLCSAAEDPARTSPAASEVRLWCTHLNAQIREQLRDLSTLLPWAELLRVQPAPFGDGQPLVGDLRGRPHVLPDLVTPPGGAPRTLSQLADVMSHALATTDGLLADLEHASVAAEVREAARAWLLRVQTALADCQAQRIRVLQRAEALATLCLQLFDEMDFSFLYDGTRDLFAVGYNVPNACLDTYHYDLLASECRLASFIAIAKGDVPEKHWFRMGRALTVARGERALVSWGGTMFEYLMPLLVMRAYEGTLLQQTLPATVRIQQRFAAREAVPWGISESGFFARDQQLNYQYRTFGVPGLGLKPDLADDLVIAPYATLLALPVAPADAVRNLRRLAQDGLGNPYGFYEAADYTPSRLPRGEKVAIVRSLMAHHQGMALVSIANVLTDNRMQERFHADPLVKSVELLLQERTSRAPARHPLTQKVLLGQTVHLEPPPDAVRHYTSAQTSTPRVQLLSNGRYTVMVTNAGGGYSTCGGLAVTRWVEDVTRDALGQFVYVRDVRGGGLWSIAQQPVTESGADYDVYFTEDKAEFQRRMDGLAAHLEIAVSAEDNAEVRRITLTNTSDSTREVELTSYAEVVLAPAAADRAHPAFSNLFIETEFSPESGALLATRRPRSASQTRAWAFHVLAHEGVPSEIWAETRYETDRARFLGRGHTAADPQALVGGHALSNTTGPVLDPIFSLQQRVRIGPRERVQLSFSTGTAESREEALRLAARYHDLRMASRTFELAWTHSQIELRSRNLSSDQASLFQRLASRLLYVDSFTRVPEAVLARNTLGQSGLWAYGISGDLPIVLVQVSTSDHLRLVRELLLAHEYLRLKGLRFDLVILNEHPPSYLQEFEQALQDMVRTESEPQDQPGGVFIRRAELIPDAGRTLLQFVARAVFNGGNGSLVDQLDWRPDPHELPARFAPSRQPHGSSPMPSAASALRYFNGYGGFSPGGEEYVVQVEGGHWTPAPWINVVANPHFGFLASEAGPGYTWSENSRENRLTPWSNDPVSDTPGEVVYLRNEETGRYWPVTPLSDRDTNPYLVRHGAGYTSYRHESHGVEQTLTVFVPPDDPVKLYRLVVTNVTDRVQRLSATLYAEWVLGVFRDQTYPYVSTWLDPETGALLARNSYNGEFAQRVAFADSDQEQRTWTCDRTEFLGRNGSVRRPRALSRAELGEAAGASLDPCAAIQVRITLAPGETREIGFTLGEGADVEQVRSLIRTYRQPAEVERSLAGVHALWKEVLGAVQVKTPDPALDLLLNRWLLYQVLACRVWARSAFYQSGGAYGFRDQLQDVMALTASGGQRGRETARAQILIHAGRQFTEGDVQHWWHPPTGRGIRTRFSDDLLWLPYVTAHYIRATGDVGILDETAPFIHGRPLAEGEDEYYDQPSDDGETGTLYEHCLRALRHGMTAGAHGLPLMGTGDWNDGMNLVGNHGRGESVWVAWFLIAILQEFAPLCDARGEGERGTEFLAAAERYRAAVEREAWDGAWYRRAYFDDGTPLGSAESPECRIDSIAQSWAVISGAGDPERARQAMRAVDEQLVRERDRLILLFTPPFDKSALDPGYIKGYVPGVRENGGQYTHAALWTVLASALLGEGDRAHELFSLLNPVLHGSSAEEIETYRVEPYVVAADVYGAPPHTGRGGWTWYTGSASWMYRVGLEAMLGFRLHGAHLVVDPCIPAAWPGFEIDYRHGASSYHITVDNAAGVQRGVREITLDGRRLDDSRIPLVDDGKEHVVHVEMSTRESAAG